MNDNRALSVSWTRLFTRRDGWNLCNAIGFSSIPVQGAIPGLVSVESTAVDGILGWRPGDNSEPGRSFLGRFSQWILGCDMHGADRLSLNLLCPATRKNPHALVTRASWYGSFVFGFTVIVIRYNDYLAEDILENGLTILIVPPPRDKLG